MVQEPAPIGKLSIQDIKKIVITAALVGGLTAVLPMLSAPAITIMVVLKAFGIGAATGGIGELIRRLGTNSNDEFLTKEPKKTPLDPNQN